MVARERERERLVGQRRIREIFVESKRWQVLVYFIFTGPRDESKVGVGTMNEEGREGRGGWRGAYTV